MANFDNNDRANNAGVAEIIGTPTDDVISISGTFLLSGTTSGVIHGGGGTDRLELTSANLENVDLSGIEETQIQNNGTIFLDADELNDLGALSITNTFTTSPTNDANLRLNFSNSASPFAIAIGTGSTLGSDERLSISTTGQASGDQVTIDFSAMSMAVDSRLLYAGAIADETITGTSGDDDLRGSSGTNSISGGAGNDTLTAGSGFSTLLGGNGDDSISTSSTSGLFDGGAGNDALDISIGFFTSGARQPSTVLGGTGEDTIIVRSSQGDGSQVDAGADNDAITLSSATIRNATVDGGTGTNALTVSSTTDARGTDFVNIASTVLANNGTFTVDADEVADLGALDITDVFSNTSFDANITLNYNGLGASTTTSFAALSGLGAGERLSISTTGQSSGQQAILDFSAIGRADPDTLLRYTGSTADETITGTSGDDNLRGSSGTNFISGGVGNDTLTAGSGFSTLLGGSGDDSISTSSTSGLFDGGDGDDTLDISVAFSDGTRQPSTILGGLGQDTITVTSVQGDGALVDGGADDDAITLNSATLRNGTIDGGAGTNTLTVTSTNASGTDFVNIASTLLANSGTFTVDADEVADLGALDITDVFSNTSFDANITLNYNGLGASTTTSFAALSGLGAGERLSISTTGQSSGQQAILDFSAIGRADPDTLLRYTGSTADETITGTSGDDNLRGSSGTNFISGGVGNDTLTAGSGFSTLLGGSGDDSISTSSTSGLFDGGDGDDTLDISVAFSDGTRQPSTILGGLGQDTITVTSVQGDGALVDGGADDDAITLNSATLRNGTIDGGAGTNTLTVTSTNASGTDFENIVSTLLTSSGTFTVDADEVADLGALSITNVFSNTSNDANITLSYVGLGTAAPIVTDFSTLSDLGANERLRIAQTGQVAGQDAVIDLSGIGRSGVDSFVTFSGGSANETVTGTDGDDAIDVRTGTNSASGGLGNDSLNASSGYSTLEGGAGNDTLAGSGTAGLLDGGADDDVITLSASHFDGTRQPVTVLGGSGLDDITVSSVVGAGSRIDGGTEDDALSLVSATYTDSTIDGGTGTDALTLRSSNLSGTDVEGIESTFIENNGTITIDAAEVDDLGSLTITDVFDTQNTSRDSNITLRNHVGETADFSGLELTGTQRLFVSSAFQTNGVSTFDFSGVTASAGTVIEARGISSNGRDEIMIASETVDLFNAGSSGSDTISYQGSDAAVTVDLATNIVSGGFADGDVISNFENATGSAFDDNLSGTTGVNIMTGLGGDDTYTTLADDDIVVVSEDNGDDLWADFASGGGVNKVDLRDLPKDAAILGFLTASEVSGNTVMNFITGGSITLQGEALADFTIDDVILEDGVYAIDEVFSGNEDQTITGNILDPNPPFNFADLEILNQMLEPAGGIEVQDFTVEGQTSAAGGTLTFASGATLMVASTGDFTYDPTNGAGAQALSETLLETLAQDWSYTAISTGTGETDVGDVGMTIDARNDAPVIAGAVTAAVNEDDAVISVDMLAQSSDVDNGEVLNVTNVGVLPAGVIHTGNTFTFDPANAAYQPLNQGEDTVVTVTYDVVDLFGAVTTGGASVITVTGTNDTPTLGAGTLTATEDGGTFALNLAPLGDDIDAENDGTNLTYAESYTGTEGSASVSGTTLTFDVGGDFQSLAGVEEQQVLVDISATDLRGATANNVVTVTVTGVNDDPTLTAGTLTADEDGSAVTLNLATLGDDVDSDDDGSSLTYTVIGAPSEGTASILGTTLTFNPGADFQDLAVGEMRDVTIDVEADDGNGGTATNTVTVTVTGVNDVPAITNPTLSFAIDENTATVATITSSDPDTTDPAIHTLAGGADAALFQIDSSTGVLSFIAPPDFETPLDQGVDNVYDVNVSVSDGTDTDVEAVQVTVNDVTENAVATVSIGVVPTSGDEGDIGTASVTFTVSRTGSTAAAVTAALVVSGSADASDFTGAIPTNVTLGVGESTATFTVDIIGDITPELDETISVAIQSVDRADHAIGVAAATHTILNDDNTAPVGVDDGPFAIDEDAGGTTGNVLINDTDVDPNILLVSGADSITALGAPVTDNGDGTFTIAGGGVYEALDAGDMVSDSFSYTVSDGNGGTDTATVSLSVSGQNDTPTVVAGTLDATEDGGAVTLDLATLASDADADDTGATLTYALVAPVAGVSLSGSVLEFNPGSGFQSLAAGATTDVTVQVTATDAVLATSAPATVTITITGVDDVPIFSSASSFSLGENQSAVGTVQATDVDASGPVTYSIVGGADSVLFQIDSTTGDLSFAVAPDFESPTDDDTDGVYEVLVRADGGAGSVADQAISVTVTDVVEGPVLNQITGTNGSDRLFGTAGADRIDPLGGPLDVIFGGDGADVFDFSTSATNGAREANYIFDFDASEGDLLDIGTANVALSATLGGNTFVNLDGEGEQIVLVGVSAFETDFLL